MAKDLEMIHPTIKRHKEKLRCKFCALGVTVCKKIKINNGEDERKCSKMGT